MMLRRLTRVGISLILGIAGFSGSTCLVLSQVVNPAATAVALTSSLNPAIYGQAVTFTATVSSASGTPTGRVTFKNAGATLGTATLAGGVASLTTTTLSSGSRSITALYGGSAAFSASTSPVLNQVIDPLASAVTLKSSLNPSTYGQAVTFTATVSSASGTPTGRVTFKNAGSTLGTATLAGGVASLTTSTPNAGTRSITAVYGGDTEFSGSTSPVLNQVVNKAATTIALTSSLNPSTFGQSVTFTATVSSSAGTPTRNVTFDGYTAALVGGVATYAMSWLTPGTHVITTFYSGSTNFNGSSATLTQTVSPVTSPTYTLTSTPLNPSSVTAGNTSTSTITVNPSNGYTGSVTLSCSTITGGPPAPACSFSPSTVTISGTTSGVSTMTVHTTSSTAVSNYTISVTGSDTNNLPPVNGPQALALTAVPAGLSGYVLSATPLNPGSVTSGNTSTSTIMAIPSDGYTGSVSLSCSISGGSTPTPTCAFNPTTVTISGATSGTSTMTVYTTSNATLSNYKISVIGSDSNKSPPLNGPPALTLTTTSVIQHILVIFQENRTPDNLFHDPVLISRGADIASSGMNSLGQTIPLRPIDLGTSGSNPQNYGLTHFHSDFVAMYDGGKMDGADLIQCYPATQCPPNAHPNPQFMYVNPADVQPYFAMAEQYTFGDRMFQTNQGPSFPAHQFIIAGTSAPTATSPLFDSENISNGGGLTAIAGCIAPLTETVKMIDAAGSENSVAPQYPCFEHPTLTDLLDTSGVTWRYYAPSASNIWSGPVAIKHMCQPQTINGALTCTGPDWTTNVVIPQSQVLTDITNGQLAQVSWVIPNGKSSDHDQGSDGSGPSWVGSIVNAIGSSPYWANTAIIVTWDDWGGWYDHVAPKVISDGVSWGSGYVYGFRVPLLVISPYAKAAYISHVTHDFGSILKFIEGNFSLPSLGYADGPADDLSDCFDLTQAPLAFQTIPSPMGAAHFINDKSPAVVPDDD